jgi:hypothetical protein
MADLGVVDAYEEERERAHELAALHTSGHAWRTAAVMTFFLSPFGFVFGSVALVLMRGLGKAIDSGRSAEARSILRNGRFVVLLGTALAAAAFVVALGSMTYFAFTMQAQLEQLRQSGGAP